MFSLEPANHFARSLADALDVALSPHKERVFEDGEPKLRPLADPRGADIYVVQSLRGGLIDGPHDKLCRLLMFIGTLKDDGAARVTAVVPYLAYAREDQRTKPYDPLGLRYVAQWLESAGMAQLIVLEAHNVAALQNAFRSLREAGRSRSLRPTPGGVKRALLWREALELQLRQPVGFAMIDKRCSAAWRR